MGKDNEVAGGPHFVESVHIELPDEGAHPRVPEIARQQGFLKDFDVFDDEGFSIFPPLNDGRIFCVGQYFLEFGHK